VADNRFERGNIIIGIHSGERRHQASHWRYPSGFPRISSQDANVLSARYLNSVNRSRSCGMIVPGTNRNNASPPILNRLAPWEQPAEIDILQ